MFQCFWIVNHRFQYKCVPTSIVTNCDQFVLEVLELSQRRCFSADTVTCTLNSFFIGFVHDWVQPKNIGSNVNRPAVHFHHCYYVSCRKTNPKLSLGLSDPLGVYRKRHAKPRIHSRPRPLSRTKRSSTSKPRVESGFARITLSPSVILRRIQFAVYFRNQVVDGVGLAVLRKLSETSAA